MRMAVQRWHLQSICKMQGIMLTATAAADESTPAKQHLAVACPHCCDAVLQTRPVQCCGAQKQPHAPHTSADERLTRLRATLPAA